MAVDPLVTMTAAIGFGGLLLLAGRHKLMTHLQFRALIRDYRVLPTTFVAGAAWSIAAAELIIGGAWLFTLTGRMPATAPAVLTAMLLFAYTLAIASNLLRGRRHIDCGCGLSASHAGGQPLSWWLVVRNGVLIAVALTAASPASGRQLGSADYVTLAAAVLTATLLYLAAAQLLRNLAAMGAWRRERD